MDEVFKGSYFYCCGLVCLLDVFDKCSESYLFEYCYSECFIVDVEVVKGGYIIVFVCFGKIFYISEEQIILDVLKVEKIVVFYVCVEGICGSCEVKVLEGKLDYCDDVFSDVEKVCNDIIMVCCFGVFFKQLVLDL